MGAGRCFGLVLCSQPVSGSGSATTSEESPSAAAARKQPPRGRNGRVAAGRRRAMETEDGNRRAATENDESAPTPTMPRNAVVSVNVKTRYRREGRRRMVAYFIADGRDRGGCGENRVVWYLPYCIVSTYLIYLLETYRTILIRVDAIVTRT